MCDKPIKHLSDSLGQMFDGQVQRGMLCNRIGQEPSCLIVKIFSEKGVTVMKNSLAKNIRLDFMFRFFVILQSGTGYLFCFCHKRGCPSGRSGFWRGFSMQQAL